MNSRISLGETSRAPDNKTIATYYQAMRRFWHPVLPAAELAIGALRGIMLLEEPVVLARLNGEVVAMQDHCRHFQAQLSLGEITSVAGAGECIMCPYHGWAYAASGQCVQIPQLATQRQIPGDARVPRYHVAERYGLIWVCLDDDPQYPIPHILSLDDSSS